VGGVYLKQAYHVGMKSLSLSYEDTQRKDNRRLRTKAATS